MERAIGKGSHNPIKPAPKRGLPPENERMSLVKGPVNKPIESMYGMFTYMYHILALKTNQM